MKHATDVEFLKCSIPIQGVHFGIVSIVMNQLGSAFERQPRRRRSYNNRTQQHSRSCSSNLKRLFTNNKKTYHQIWRRGKQVQTCVDFDPKHVLRSILRRTSHRDCQLLSTVLISVHSLRLENKDLLQPTNPSQALHFHLSDETIVAVYLINVTTFVESNGAQLHLRHFRVRVK